MMTEKEILRKNVKDLQPFERSEGLKIIRVQ